MWLATLVESPVDCYINIGYYFADQKKKINVDFAINYLWSVIATRRTLFKFVPVLFAVLWPYNDGHASDWIGIPLSKLIGTSELIVYGRVKQVLDSTILFQVSHKIGDEKADIIEILKAERDSFASVKPAPYEAGQCYLLFLCKSQNTLPKLAWKVMGKAQEGQMPVIGNYIYFTDRYVEGIPIKQYKVNGVELDIQRLEFSSFLDALEGYKQCYRWTRQGQEEKYLVTPLCGDNQITLYKNKGFLPNYLVTETQAFISNK
jgi:hypothetical protein